MHTNHNMHTIIYKHKRLIDMKLQQSKPGLDYWETRIVNNDAALTHTQRIAHMYVLEDLNMLNMVPQGNNSSRFSSHSEAK